MPTITLTNPVCELLQVGNVAKCQGVSIAEMLIHTALKSEETEVYRAYETEPTTPDYHE